MRRPSPSRRSPSPTARRCWAGRSARPASPARADGPLAPDWLGEVRSAATERFDRGRELRQYAPTPAGGDDRARLANMGLRLLAVAGPADDRLRLRAERKPETLPGHPLNVVTNPRGGQSASHMAVTNPATCRAGGGTG